MYRVDMKKFTDGLEVGNANAKILLGMAIVLLEDAVSSHNGFKMLVSRFGVSSMSPIEAFRVSQQE